MLKCPINRTTTDVSIPEKRTILQMWINLRKQTLDIWVIDNILKVDIPEEAGSASGGMYEAHSKRCFFVPYHWLCTGIPFIRDVD
jgi:hypothetical protein